MAQKISAERKTFWQDFVSKNKGKDPNWHRKMQKAWPRTRRKEFKKIQKKLDENSLWKMAQLLQLAEENNEDYKKFVDAYHFSNAKHKDYRRLLVDFEVTTGWEISNWLNNNLKTPSVNMDAVREIHSYGAKYISEWTVRALGENNNEQALEFLQENDLLSENCLSEAIQHFIRCDRLIYANRLMKYLPKDQQVVLSKSAIGEKPNVARPNGWHKIDDHTISRIKSLPGNLECQDVFNFHAREITSITRSTESDNPQIAQTIRHFDDVAENRTIERAACELALRDGTPDIKSASDKKCGTARPLPLDHKGAPG